MAVFVSLGRRRLLPFIKIALVVDVDIEHAEQNLELFKKYHTRITKFACYSSEQYKYIWTVYYYMGKEENFAHAVHDMQEKVLIYGYTDYVEEASKMISNLATYMGKFSVTEVKN